MLVLLLGFQLRQSFSIAIAFGDVELHVAPPSATRSDELAVAFVAESEPG